jgi:hypothetical protein
MCRGSPTKLHGLTSQKTVILIFTAVRVHKNCVMKEVLLTKMLNNCTIHILAVLCDRAGFMNKLAELQLRVSHYNEPQ